jgi:AmmeMemoRadiSam system protein B/AmmeMemoRadiSam system protein A
MRMISIIMFSIICIMETFSQNKTADRKPYAAGRFYSADKKTLSSDISGFFQSCPRTPASWNVRAIISPHAGYVFSGKIAAEAFHSIPANTVYKNIFVIGSSHVMAFDGASVYGSGDYITPLGKATVNREIAVRLIKDNKVFNFPENAHLQEHSLEVQIPFIQSYFKEAPDIVPIIIGTQNQSTVRKIADALRPYFTSENLFIISSDFSHYPSYADAEKTDSLTSLGISSANPQTFLNTIKKNSEEEVPGLLTSMCGWTSGLTLLYLIEGNKNLEIRHIDYCNSGDSPYGNKNEVVGYHAFAVIDKHDITERSDSQTSDIVFTRAEKNQLFKIAENSIRTMLYENKRIVLDDKDMTATMKRQLGAFVTLKVDGALRGCIGRFISTDPLYNVVKESALSSAFEDTRFTPLTKEEFEKTEIEITVLGPLRKINDISEIVLGKHGIYIKKGYRSGTMLPQVAIENKWTVEEFLGYTSRDKAGIGWSGWKDAELYVYEGVVLRR